MFIGLGDNHVVTTCNIASNAAGAAISGGQFCFDHDFGGVHTAKIGLNYRFGAPRNNAPTSRHAAQLSP